MNLTLRMRVIAAALIGAYALLGLRLFHLSVVRGAELRERAIERMQRRMTLPALRGSILDRHGEVVARDEPTWDLHVRISQLDGRQSIRRLARRLHIRTSVLKSAVDQLEEQVGASPGPTELRLPGLIVHPSERDLLNMRMAPEDTWGFWLHPEPSGDLVDAYAVYVDLDELRGRSSIRRAADLLGEECSAEELAELVNRKHVNLLEALDRRFEGVEISPRRRRRAVADREAQSFPIVFDVPAELARAIGLHPEAFVGFEHVARVVRRYPAGDSAMPMIGQVTLFRDLRQDIGQSRLKQAPYNPANLTGAAGVEAAFEEALHGVDGFQFFDRDRDGGGKALIAHEPPRNGVDVRLTIDLELQRIAERALDASGRPGAVVAMDVIAGEVLVLASSPRIDPEEISSRWEEIGQLHHNPLTSIAVRPAFDTPPGSVFKLVTAIAGLETGKIVPGVTLHDCLPGKRPYCGNHSVRGAIGFEDAVAWSCNCYFGDVAQDCGRVLDHWIWRLGFGERTGIEIYDHSYRSAIVRARGLDSLAVRRKGIGQEVQTTPLQVARLTAAIANGGYMVTPHLELSNSATPRRKLDLRPGTLPALRRTMEEVVDRGTARDIGLGALQVAGKTGSAETWATKNRDMPTHAWFTGYAPRVRPEIAVTVFLDHAGHGGEMAAPIAREVFAAYFQVEEDGR